MNTLSEDFLKELECPVCLDYMASPIWMCESGHNICSSCRPRINACPTCRQPFLPVRNKALENLSVLTKAPCPYKKYGCQLVFGQEDFTEHKTVCPYRPYNCPLSKAEGIMCKWTGIRPDLKEHIQAEHRNRLTELDFLKEVLIRKFRREMKYSRVIIACGEIFYQQFEVINNVFYFVVQHVGPENYKSKFQYNFTISSRQHPESISISFIARSCRVDIETIYRSGQCVKLFFDTVKNFFDENNNFKFEFYITRI
jgi:E3 ubiquitin-protein ligase SIAH1